MARLNAQQKAERKAREAANAAKAAEAATKNADSILAEEDPDAIVAAMDAVVPENERGTRTRKPRLTELGLSKFKTEEGFYAAMSKLPRGKQNRILDGFRATGIVSANVSNSDLYNEIREYKKAHAA